MSAGAEVMTPTRMLATQAGTWVEFEHPRAILFVQVTLDEHGIGWEVRLTGSVIERIDREPRSVSDLLRFESRREAAERACEVIAEVGAMADRAANGMLQVA